METSQRFVFSEFSFDCETCELTRNGRRLRIPDQTARLLTVLLHKEGGLVTREEIRQFLWPDGEFLDHDHSINKNVSQLRAILRDDRNAPRYVETIPKRGYRFLGAVPVVPTGHGEAGAKPSLAITLSSGESLVPDKGPGVGILDLEIRNALPEISAPRDTPRKLLSARSGALFGLAAALLIALGVTIYSKTRPQAPRIVHMGIAPFEFSGDGAQQLAESLRVDLTDAIAQLPEVQVLAAHSLEGKKAGDDSIRDIAKSLRLDSIIYGHFTLTDDHFALQLELIRCVDAAHLASFHYDGTRKELPLLGERVQRDIFSHLALTRESGNRAAERTSDPKAYESYLRGRFLLAERTEDSLHKAFAEFNTAATLDPHFASADAGMAHAEMILAEHEAIPADEAFVKTRELANHALALAPYMSEAHALLGYSAFRLDWDLATAERELRQAIKLDPNQSVYHVWLSVLLCDEGRFDESFQQIDEAHSLEPLWAPIFLTEAFLGASSRRNDRMLAAADKLVSLMPDWPLAHEQLAWSLWFAGRSDEAVAEWRNMAVLEKDSPRVEFEEKGLDLLHRKGRVAYAQMRLNACLKGFKTAHSNDFVPAEWYAYAGQNNQALQLLQQVVARHQQDALELTVNPAFFEMHSDPRFRSLVTKVGLPFPAVAAKS